jgi:hypothetical protein
MGMPNLAHFQASDLSSQPKLMVSVQNQRHSTPQALTTDLAANMAQQQLQDGIKFQRGQNHRGQPKPLLSPGGDMNRAPPQQMPLGLRQAIGASPTQEQLQQAYEFVARVKHEFVTKSEHLSVPHSWYRLTTAQIYPP